MMQRIIGILKHLNGYDGVMQNIIKISNDLVDMF